MALGRQLTNQGWLLLKKQQHGVVNIFLVEIDYFVISFTSCRSVVYIRLHQIPTDECKFVEVLSGFFVMFHPVTIHALSNVYTPPMFRP